MPRNDRSDSLSVRGDTDPRRPLKALQQEAEEELLREEAGETGGPSSRGEAERRRTPEELEYEASVRRATDEQDRDREDRDDHGREEPR